MSYYFFQKLPRSKGNIFINNINNSNNQIFTITKIKKFTIFSEFDLSNRGFGKPDGAVFFIYNSKPVFVFIEAKINETYAKSNLNSKYNSSLKGQIELKYRFSYALKNSNNKEKVLESEEFRMHYQSDNYKHPIPRHVYIKDGVEKVIDFIKLCSLKNIYFLIITQDEKNPLISNEIVLPVFYKNDQLRSNILWINQQELL
jgi:hypothetical protein